MAYGAQKEFATTNRVMMWWSALISVVLLCLPLAAGAGAKAVISAALPYIVGRADLTLTYQR